MFKKIKGINFNKVYKDGLFSLFFNYIFLIIFLRNNYLI